MSENEKFSPEKETLKWEKVAEDGSTSGFVDIYDEHNQDFQNKVNDGLILVKRDEKGKIVEIAISEEGLVKVEKLKAELRGQRTLVGDIIRKEINHEDKLKDGAGAVKINKKLSMRPKWKEEVNNLSEDIPETTVVDRPAES